MVACEMCNEEGCSAPGHECYCHEAAPKGSNAQLREQLAVHAPACPEWFQPVNMSQTSMSILLARAERLASWPWVYADAVLSAKVGQ